MSLLASDIGYAIDIKSFRCVRITKIYFPSNCLHSSRRSGISFVFFGDRLQVALMECFYLHMGLLSILFLLMPLFLSNINHKLP